jgi:hypothetical protein
VVRLLQNTNAAAVRSITEHLYAAELRSVAARNARAVRTICIKSDVISQRLGEHDAGFYAVDSVSVGVEAAEQGIAQISSGTNFQLLLT